MNEVTARTMYEECPTVDRVEDKRRWPLVITTTACLLIIIYAGTYFVIQFGQTTLQFEINAPTLAVRFMEDNINVVGDYFTPRPPGQLSTGT